MELNAEHLRNGVPTVYQCMKLVHAKIFHPLPFVFYRIPKDNINAAALVCCNGNVPIETSEYMYVPAPVDWQMLQYICMMFIHPAIKQQAVDAFPNTTALYDILISNCSNYAGFVRVQR